MPTALVRVLKASKTHFFERPLHVHKAGYHHIVIFRSIWCRGLAWPQFQQRCTEPGRQRGFSLLLSPTPNGKKARTCFFSLADNLGVVPRKHFSVLKMEEGKGKVSIQENVKKSSEVAKEEKSRLQKEQEKKTEEENEEERRRVKEQEMEAKIGPPPEKPLPDDCCDQGCEVCVWDTYWDELDKYKKLRKAAEEESG